ncbi:hypothetical protein OGATHE_004009 [Ogataea polymorpha]|uniref:Secreted protein n=1 Tax=Ogataea polymorpha TaxID=460523 RepID=A0A9P8T4F0_9ASCO|nr:hypothetical protein OGATHE_004009 [Ogataea polymorpha]
MMSTRRKLAARIFLLRWPIGAGSDSNCGTTKSGLLAADDSFCFFFFGESAGSCLTGSDSVASVSIGVGCSMGLVFLGQNDHDCARYLVSLGRSVSSFSASLHTDPESGSSFGLTGSLLSDLSEAFDVDRVCSCCVLEKAHELSSFLGAESAASPVLLTFSWFSSSSNTWLFTDRSSWFMVPLLPLVALLIGDCKSHRLIVSFTWLFKTESLRQVVRANAAVQKQR